MSEGRSQAEQAGAAIGMTFGMAQLFMLWMVGLIIFGGMMMTTRGKKIIVEETVDG